ncbi:hypothetical protein [Robbsia andropogonis]|uniref:hypothetical protein n=1 Tax=Robbsia andropogonis TaxID=28092 RepID=UPI00209E0C05|nr:hypothetical protein [Robbsia andropogonis]MCP1119923.1 hypothetical protein [Robbsia andropogonis]MCP1129793.1 hypothetical protein [Robbsia andropogonis]
MKPSIADTARAYLFPSIATVCSAQVLMLLAMVLFQVPESVFQGPTFRFGMVLAVAVSIVSLRRRARRAFHLAHRRGDVRMHALSSAMSVAISSASAATAEPLDARRQLCASVAAASPHRALVVLYLQFRRIPFVIESRDCAFPAASAHHA